MTDKHQYDIGMVGLGVMGCNLLLNMADRGFAVTGYDTDPVKVGLLQQHGVSGSTDLKTFIDSLRLPRAIMLLVPAGAPVDAVIEALLPHLQPDDVIIDGGNSYFKDTAARTQRLIGQGIHFLGVGISGGEEGARHGPSIMPGGEPQAYARIQPILEAIAARVEDAPCVTYLGRGAAGHFVKMVHNGIEYGLMQLLAESYDLLKRGLGTNNEQLHQIYSEWSQSELNAFLVEITAHIFTRLDDTGEGYLIDKIKSEAHQKGTGLWTSQCAMELQVPTPTIDVAVAMRDLSVLTQERIQAHALYQGPTPSNDLDLTAFTEQLKHAVFAAIMLTYVQGMALLQVASKQYDFQLDLASVARIWRGGCIIRATMLDTLVTAFKTNDGLANLLLAPQVQQALAPRLDALRHIVCHAAIKGIAVPGLMASLSYLDGYCSSESPANLIQAQRDYFGAHTYERTDIQGSFHTEWSKG